MKKLTIYRGKSTAPLKLACGDVMGDRGELTDENGVIMWIGDNMATVPSLKEPPGGKLAAGKWYGILGPRWNPTTNDWAGKVVIKYFLPKDRAVSAITDHTNLSDEEMILQSEIPNPNHMGLKIVQYPQGHDCGLEYGPVPDWNWSDGCTTVYNVAGDYSKLKACLKINEVIAVELVG